MNKQEFLEQLKDKTEKFNELHEEIVSLVKEFKADENNDYTVDTAYELRDFEQLCFTYAWVVDQLNNKDGFVGGKTYNKSTTKKIRKALGYTL